MLRVKSEVMFVDDGKLFLLEVHDSESADEFYNNLAGDIES